MYPHFYQVSITQVDPRGLLPSVVSIVNKTVLDTEKVGKVDVMLSAFITLRRRRNERGGNFQK